MRVELDRPLAPKGITSLELGYSFQVPEHGADRMGAEQFPAGWLYEIAQWYPRLAVYDDVRGWNTEQYLARRVLSRVRDIDFAITVPRGFIVAATAAARRRARTAGRAPRKPPVDHRGSTRGSGVHRRSRSLTGSDHGARTPARSAPGFVNGVAATMKPRGTVIAKSMSPYSR